MALLYEIAPLQALKLPIIKKSVSLLVQTKKNHVNFPKTKFMIYGLHNLEYSNVHCV